MLDDIADIAAAGVRQLTHRSSRVNAAVVFAVLVACIRALQPTVLPGVVARCIVIMPRPPSTCAGFKLSPDLWCPQCKDKKAGCFVKTRPPWPREGAPETVVSTAAAHAAAPAAVGTAAGSAGAGAATGGSSARQRNKPAVFEPHDTYFRRELPCRAERMGTWLRASEREQALSLERSGIERLAAFKEGVQVASQQAETASQEAEAVVVQIRGRLDEMYKELERERRESAKLRVAVRVVEAGKRQKILAALFSNSPPPAPGGQTRCRGEPAELGSGYTQRNVASGCFLKHVKAIEDQIIDASQGDSLKQLQLATAVSQRLNGIRALRDRDIEAWSYVRNALKAFFAKIHERHRGRFPQHMRAAQQAVCAAISNAAPQRKLHVLASEFNISAERLSEGRKHWTSWLCGDRESIADLCGQARSDRMPDEWLAHAVDTWTGQTRRSERAKDSLRNPSDKSDKTLYRVHWLEVRMGDIHNIIIKEGARKFNVLAVTAVAKATHFDSEWEGIISS